MVNRGGGASDVATLGDRVQNAAKWSTRRIFKKKKDFLHSKNYKLLTQTKSARTMGLVINQEKTVYMYSGKDTTWHQDLTIGNYVYLSN